MNPRVEVIEMEYLELDNVLQSDAGEVSPPIPPTHLDTPITTKVQQLATGCVPPHRSLRGQKNYQAELKCLLEASNLDNYPLKWDCTGVLPKLLKNIPLLRTSVCDSRTRSFIQGAFRNVKLQEQALNPDSRTCSLKGWDDIPVVYKKKILKLSQVKAFWEGVVRLTGCSGHSEADMNLFPYLNSTANNTIAGNLTSGIQIILSKNLAILTTKEEILLLNRDQLLMILLYLLWRKPFSVNFYQELFRIRQIRFQPLNYYRSRFRKSYVVCRFYSLDKLVVI